MGEGAKCWLFDANGRREEHRCLTCDGRFRPVPNSVFEQRFFIMMRHILVATCLLPVMANLAAADGPVVLPTQVTLDGPHAGQRLIVEEMRGGKAFGDLTGQAKFSTADPKVATVDAQGRVQPVGDGETVIRAEVAGQTSEAKVIVRHHSRAEPWSFANDVQAVLTKTGCNMGSCHGAQSGKKGFKLALRGYDHEADYDTLTRRSRGRRVIPSDPARSLMLLKATGAIPHGGGTRFGTDSSEYHIVSQWIAEGAMGPSAADTHVAELAVLPEQVTLKPGDAQQIVVLATYSDGTVRDVTQWAMYDTTEMGVASVSQQGKVDVVGAGESAITVWFGSKVAVATISVPYDNKVDGQLFAQTSQVNFVDDLILEKLKTLRIPPSGQAGDGEFLRRVYLDTMGILPTVEETRAFLADESPGKRERLIDQILQRSEYVDYWTYKWSDLLLVSSKQLDGAAVWAFYSWLRKCVEENKPWDQLARDVVTARGSTLDNGAANFFVLHKDPQQLTEATSLTFLGMSITCARCHDHPMERWTQDDYYGMANLFGRVRQKDGTVGGEIVVFPVTEGNVPHPRRLEVPIPQPLDGEPLAVDDPRDRRTHLAAWLTAAENPYFARAIVNRVWANFMGRGLVQPVDDLRSTNPASNEKLLSALADDLRKHNYDVKHLIRTILNSAAYQRSAAPVEGNEADDRFYSHFLLKRMPAEVMLDAFSQTTGVPTEFPGFPKGWRAQQLPDSNIVSYFLSAFGRPSREFVCTCERTEDPNVTQTLHLTNGKTLNDKLKSDDCVATAMTKEKLTDEQVIERVYLGALTRFPTEAEKAALLKAFAASTTAAVDEKQAVDENVAAEQRQALIADFIWATLSSKEFLFIH